jgi:TolB-like protein
MLSVAGKIAQRPELGMPLPDAVKAEAGKIGAQCVLVGSVSDRGELLVINATLVDLATGQIIATARASQ